MTSHHHPTPFSGADAQAEPEASRLNIPRVYVLYASDGILHLLRRVGTVDAGERRPMGEGSGLPCPPVGSPPSRHLAEEAQGGSQIGGTVIQLHTARETPDIAVAEPVTNSEYSPLDGRTQPISHRQRVAVGCAPDVGVVQVGGGSGRDRFHVSYASPFSPCGHSGAYIGEYSTEVRPV